MPTPPVRSLTRLWPWVRPAATRLAAVSGVHAVKLLARLYDPTQGRVLLDGVDLCDLADEDLRGSPDQLLAAAGRFARLYRNWQATHG